MQPPSQVVFKNHSATRWLSLVAFFPLVITIFVFAGAMLTDEIPLEEWRTPLLGISGMSLFGFLAALLTDQVLNRWEKHRIHSVYDNVWAIWPQFPSEEKWRKFTESEYQKEIRDTGFSFIPIIIVGVVVGAIGAGFGISEGEISIVFALAGFMFIVTGIIVGEWYFNKRDIEARYQRRKNSPPPNTVISRDGHYDEDWGFSTLRGLKQIEYKKPGKTSQARINFVIHIRWWEYWLHDEYTPRAWRVQVKVPKGYEEEAEALVERFRAEVLR